MPHISPSSSKSKMELLNENVRLNHHETKRNIDHILVNTAPMSALGKGTFNDIRTPYNLENPIPITGQKYAAPCEESSLGYLDLAIMNPSLNNKPTTKPKPKTTWDLWTTKAKFEKKLVELDKKDERSTAPFLNKLDKNRVAPEKIKLLYDTIGEGVNWRDRRGWTTEDWQKNIMKAGNHIFSITTEEGKIAGYTEIQQYDANAHAHPKHESHCYLTHYGLLPRYQSKGWGGKLFRALVKEGLKMESSMTLDTSTWDKNPTTGRLAKQLYEYHGFKVFNTTITEE